MLAKAGKIQLLFFTQIVDYRNYNHVARFTLYTLFYHFIICN